MRSNDTIFALSTPRGKSAIAVFRISGSGAHKIVKKISSNKKTKINKTILNNIIDFKKKPIDQTITTYFKNPHSFTGEDMVEISCHGGTAVIDRITRLLVNGGLRIAEPGEFTRRSLENNKLDLINVEGLSDLINAKTEKQREAAYNNYSGSLTNFLNLLSKKIKNMIANAEAIIDFADEELPKNLLFKIKEQNRNIISSIEKTIETSKNFKAIKDGIKVSVIGKPNTGKSSFVNYVSKRDVSIVTSSPGTTRDLVESHVEISGYQFIFVDSAGIRKHTNNIEKIGVSKAIKLANISDLNLVFLKNIEKKEYSKIKRKIFVRSKYDIIKGLKKDKGVKYISSITGYGIKNLLNKIIKETLPKIDEEIPIISRERQLNKIKNCLKQLKKIDLNGNLDMLAADMRFALKEIEEVYHKFDIEEILDIIFNDFCIGK